MNFTALFVLAIALLPALGVAAWVWRDVVHMNADLRALTGFDGMHLEP